MTELTLRYDRQSADEPLPSGDEWTTREGAHIDFSFTAMRAARAMGLQVVSLSPIGEGPRASIIADALAREDHRRGSTREGTRQRLPVICHRNLPWR